MLPVRLPSTFCGESVPTSCAPTAFGDIRSHRQFFSWRRCFFSGTHSSPVRRPLFSRFFFLVFPYIGCGLVPEISIRSDLHERGWVTMTTGFSAMDYAVMLFYLVGITVWGALFRRSQRTVKDYFLGAKNISWFVISISIVATETSTLTLIGVPALAYSTFARPEQGGNLSYLQIVFVYIIARVIISLLFIPAYFQGELLTAYELLKRRFGMRTKHFAASLFLVMRALAEGVRVFAASIVLSAVLSVSLPGLPQLWLWSIIIVGVLTLLYTFEGGITAVIWTDLVQFILYIGGSHQC